MKNEILVVDDNFDIRNLISNILKDKNFIVREAANFDQAVLDRKNRIIIVSRNHGLIVYDHQERTFTNYDNFKLKENRDCYAAILPVSYTHLTLPTSDLV